jgi:cell division protein FtsA
MAQETNLETFISIPGLRNRLPKEISLRNLAQVIEARMAEIIELVYAEIVSSGYYNKLAGGIVITGGGSQLRALKKLFECITGLDTRIGYPNELLGPDVMEDIKNPMAATAIGLVLSGFKNLDHQEKGSHPTQAAAKSSSKNPFKKEKQPRDLFRRLLNRTKGLLIDDYEN